MTHNTTHTETLEAQPYERSGQATGGVVAAVVTLIAGVGVAVLVLIFVGTLGGSTYNLVEPDIDELYGQATNDTFVADAGTAVPLSYKSIDSSTFVAYNASDQSQTVDASNYTLNAAEGEFTLDASGTIWDGQTIGTNYTFGDEAIQTSVNNGIVSGFAALETTGDYLPIIVLAVVISLVLTLVLGFMAFGNMGGGNSGSAL